MNKLWIVYEDCHGDVGWWTDRNLAYDEARKIILLNEDVSYEDITDEQIDDYIYCVGVRWVYLNKTWAD